MTFINPNITGTFRATVTTTDSRGNTAEASVDINILDWAEPTAIYSLQRVDNFYTETILNVDGKISSVAGRNTLTITEKHRQAGSGSAWTTPTSVPDATDTTLNLDNLYDWEVLITVTDAFSSTEYTATVGRGIPIVFFDKKRHSLSVNGFPDDDNQFYIGGSIKATDDADVGGDIDIGGDGAIGGNLNITGFLGFEGLKVRLHKIAARTVNINQASGSIYYSEFTEDISALGFNTIYYVFASCSRTTGTNMTMISVESFDETEIKYSIYRQTSMSVSDHETYFLIIGD